VATTFEVELVAPDRIVWSGEAEMVSARTTDGDIGVLAHHIPLLGVLVDHPVTIKRAGEGDLTVNVSGGFLSISKEKVSVLAESIEDAAG
jgi:F-type H+-transporting ATPase subunit epsilon